jgi:putative protein-disulfide isomerase
MQQQVLYLFDPLCGWCYGFSDTIYQFSLRKGGDFEFVPVPGGMVIEDRVGPIGKMEDYIKSALGQVEQTTGCEFGIAYKNGLLSSKDTIMDSEPPSRALVTFRTFIAEQAISFAKDLQRAHYFDGRDYNDESLYESLAAHYGLNVDGFMARYHDPKMKQQVQQEFAWVKESGVQGFPTVVLRNENKYYLLSHGYASLDELEQSLEKAVMKIG